MYDIFILSIYCTVKPTTTYTFISQKKPGKKVWSIIILQTEAGVLDFFQSRVKTTTSVGKFFWLVDNIQNGVLIGSQTSMNNLDTQVNLL
jgi:hypothetical protein